MSRTIFREPEWGSPRELHVTDNGDLIVLSHIDESGKVLSRVALDFDMAGALADHLRDRVDDMRAEQEAKS